MSNREEKLLSRAINGETTALTELLNSYEHAIRAELSLAIGKKWQSVLDAEDVYQVTCLEAFLRIRTFKPNGIASFVAWVRRIAENNLQDAIKGLGRDKRPDPAKRVQSAGEDDSAIALLERIDGNSPSPSRILRGQERKSILEHAISQLPPEYKKVIQLYELEGRPTAEVATALNRSVGAVFMLRARALERLRTLLPSPSEILTRT